MIFSGDFPGCGKLFIRKDHLTRQPKSHDPELQHECTVYGRRCARSDILKCHLDHHSQSCGNKRTLVACTSYHERKLKCDDTSPCRSCIHSSIPCSRTATNWAGRMVGSEATAQTRPLHAESRCISQLVDGVSSFGTLSRDKYPLPKSLELWTTATEKDRRHLHWHGPAGREKVLFCFLMRDILDAGNEQQVLSYLTDADYHLALCPLQVETWETAREALSAVTRMKAYH
ncbi:hypothetical protein ACMFMG_005720 [Clarireedia jacksonii]